LNWQAIRNLTHTQVGVFLALLIVAVMPNFGLKYGASPALPAGLLALLGGWLVWKQRLAVFAAPSARRLTIVFALLLVPVLISIPASYEPRYSINVAMALVAYYFSGLALVRVLRGDAERAWLAKWILFVLAFWVADSVIQYLFGTDLFGIARTDDMRVLGPFKGSMRQPMLIALFLPVAIWVLLRKGVVPAFLFFAAAAFIATLAGARTVVVMLAIAAAGFYLRLPRWRFKIPAALLAGAIVLAAMGLTPAMKERMGLLGEIQDTKFETFDRFLSGRVTIWETASHMLIARPLTGVGAGAFAKAYDHYSTRPDDRFRGGVVEKVYHAHQEYFAMAAETGLPGLLGLIVAIVLCVKWYWTAAPDRRDQAWPYALGLSVYFFPLNSQAPFYHGNWLFPAILLLFAALLAALDGEPSAQGAKAAERDG
jgi:O-antigen ligase